MGTSGSGLGLSIVYGITKDHKGYYDVFSKEGQGTEFILYFPIIKSEASEDPEAGVRVGGTEAILVVDDVAEQRDMAAELLESFDYEVATVASGREAVTWLKSNDAALVVLDMIMEEGFDGLDTYREIITFKPGQKAIIVSGFSSTGRVEKMQELGAGSYIKKPYTREVLGQAVREELDRKLVNLQTR